MPEDNKIPFSDKAYIDPETGMYTMPEPDNTAHSGFHEVETQADKNLPPAKLHVPKPSHKSIRTLFTNPNNVRWEVDEDMDTVLARINDARKNKDAVEWYIFTDPVFGLEIALHWSTLTSVTGVIEDMKDLQAVRDQISQVAYAQGEYRKAQLQRQGRRSVLS